MLSNTSHRWITGIVGVTAPLLLATNIAVAAWSANGTGTGTATATTAQVLTVAPVTPTGLLFPGASASITIKVTNPNPYNVQVDSITFGPVSSSVPLVCTADNHGVTFTNGAGLAQVVAKNGGSVDITLTNAASMALTSVDACQGATFTATATVSGVSTS